MQQDSSRASDTIGQTGNIQIDGLFTGFKWAADSGANTTTLTFGFPSAASQFDGYGEGEETSNNFQGLTDFQQNYTRGLFDFLGKVTNLRFEERSGDKAGEAAIRFGWTEDSDAGTVAFAYVPGTHPADGDVWLNSKSFNQASTVVSDDEVGVIMHELGHALGLKHPHDVENGFEKLPTEFDGPEYTSLTYNYSTEFPDAVQSDLLPQSYMWFDIQALQKLYGKNETATAGADKYDFDLAARHYLTIWDAGGIDSITVKNGSANLNIDLTPGTWSDIGTRVTFQTESGAEKVKTKTLFIAPDTVVENAMGAGGNDKITGNDAANRLLGGEGNDTLSGGKGNDVIRGDKGSDRVSGGDGNDQAFAGAGDQGNDTVEGNSGNDTLGGGAGDDMIVGGDYTNSNSSAKAGNDVLYGGAGNDHLVAGSYNNATNSVVNVDSSENTLYAGTGNDTLDGDNGKDTLGGGAGNDNINGGAGDDVIYGGAGKTVDNNDMISAGSGNDVVFSGAGDDRTNGDDGADTLFGGGGNDMLDGGAGNDTLFGGSGADTLVGGDGNDNINGGADNDILTGGNGADTFKFATDHGDDTITDFDTAIDRLDLSATTTDFQSLADVNAAAQVTSANGVSGLLINTGGGDSIFLENVNSVNNLSVDF